MNQDNQRIQVTKEDIDYVMECRVEWLLEAQKTLATLPQSEVHDFVTQLATAVHGMDYYRHNLKLIHQNKTSKRHQALFDLTHIPIERFTDINIIINCPRCQSPSVLNLFQYLMGEGCQCCNTKSAAEVIRELEAIHGDKYDYHLLDFISEDTNLTIICKECQRRHIEELEDQQLAMTMMPVNNHTN